MVNERTNNNVYLMYQIINAVKSKVNNSDKVNSIDLDNDWPCTIIFTGKDNYHYWFYDVVKGSHIYTHHVSCTKENIDIVLYKEHEFDTIALLIQHIAEVINNIED